MNLTLVSDFPGFTASNFFGDFTSSSFTPALSDLADFTFQTVAQTSHQTSLVYHILVSFLRLQSHSLNELYYSHMLLARHLGLYRLGRLCSLNFIFIVNVWIALFLYAWFHSKFIIRFIISFTFSNLYICSNYFFCDQFTLFIMSLK